RPRKKPSNVIMPAKASRLRMLGADSRSNVGRIGPSSNSLVRAAPGCCADLTGVEVAEAIIGGGNDGEIAALRSFTRRSSPPEGSRAALGRSVLEKPGGCVGARR